MQDFNQRIATGLVLFNRPINQLKPIVATGMGIYFLFLCLCGHKLGYLVEGEMIQ
jgi:hypothetical protein